MSDKPAFINWPVCQEILSIANAHDAAARFVGGAVRNHLMGIASDDIDMAINRPIIEVAKWLRDAGIAVYETGIAHGTITVRHAAQSVELTQTRIDMKADGRHADVVPTHDWLEDAKRRDFTINAIYMDADGTLYDPLGGAADLAAGILHFIGDADARIAEDYLRILRGFRFMSEYPQLTLTDESLIAASRQLDGLDILSGERVTSEWMRLLAGAGWHRALISAHKAGLDKALFGRSMPMHDNTKLDNVRLVDELSVIGRLAWLSGAGTELPNWLRLSRVDTDLLKLYVQNLEPADITALSSEAGWQQAAYWLGPEARMRLALHHLWAGNSADLDDAGMNAGITGMNPLLQRLEALATFQRPTFPLRGGDLVNGGIAAGPLVGEMLKTLEARWVESDFSLDKAALMAFVLEEYVDA